MSTINEALGAFRAIVGQEFARADVATLSNYCWNGGVGAVPGPKFKAWPAAVVMPQSTEEVAAVVKACVRFGLNYRAVSTGNGAMYVNQKPGGIVIDLARMNRIVKIDPLNQMAVIEPYATAGRLQAAAMRHGLTCHIIGAGPGHSPLASATSMLGIGITGASTGQNARNLLALEWVTPEGEIVRIGSDGADNWFSEEGPGIGFRGMVRGYVGAHGALGVFTRIGYKLYPWTGGPKLQKTGVFPQTGWPIGENFRFYAPVWDTAEQQAAATFRLNQAGVCFAMLRMPPAHVALSLSRDTIDHAQAHRTGTLPEIACGETRFCWQILTMGHSTAQVAFQEKTVRHIVSATGGRFLEVAPEHAEILARGLVTSQYVARVSRIAVAATSYGVAESWNLWPEAVRAAETLVAASRKAGEACTEGTEGHWAWPTESRQLWTESVLSSSPDEKGYAATLSAFIRSIHEMQKNKMGVAAFIAGPVVDLFGQRYSRANSWMRRIKVRFDPGNHADDTFYIPSKQSIVSKLWPVISKILFTRFGEKLLAGAMRGAAKATFQGKSARPGGAP
ncbi:FAD-binding oxidoreductase [Nitrospirillum iridis]|uniref:Glycolate oxidase n=1 Tax=Nitrospirillum iridis TaxID=765888 RepID=A0A7X0EFP8_9PROT|nr:FAD-binding oxidoreductase [Nitrospirillum iridis]MBB6253276.1 glycolate oxidase [Nitrospirillum iridis]